MKALLRLSACGIALALSAPLAAQDHAHIANGRRIDPRANSDHLADRIAEARVMRVPRLHRAHADGFGDGARGHAAVERGRPDHRAETPGVGQAQGGAEAVAQVGQHHQTLLGAGHRFGTGYRAVQLDFGLGRGGQYRPDVRGDVGGRRCQ